MTITSRMLPPGVGLLIVGLALTGCAQEGGDQVARDNVPAAAPRVAVSPDSAVGHGATAAPQTGAALDRAFLEGMVPHHRAAVEMARVELERGSDAEVKRLAQGIVDAQQVEIDRFVQIAQSAYGFAPAGAHSGPMGELVGVVLSMDMSRMSQQLAEASEVDRTFLQMMIPHHASAIVMADVERKNGANEELKDLAGSIVADQAREIGEMQRLLGKDDVDETPSKSPKPSPATGN